MDQINMNKLKIQDRDYDLWLTLNRTTYRITRARSRELRKYGLTPEQSGIIFFIRNSGNNAKPIDISRWMLRKPQTITSIVDRMVRKGLVRKSQDLERKNVVRISLTEKGEQAYQQAAKIESFHRIMSVLTEERRQALWAALNDLRLAAMKETRDSFESDIEDRRD